ncbi:MULTISPECIES: efflux RND transporter periplasmic adaptor subunit [Thiorhodovibrio]|uniref:efflux RND transporter periplasmic adaptor subunit n=1 Tax=Thiorhodovibrio TaxID=61593 RepID=UPI001911F5E0|nr:MULTISPECIES: biotin/lipoyl-binding protein [Thiorhodovibrio]MBK5967400.1 RND transporter [Thiorhodovibrio winogradskyi]WPL12528.1 Multidrug transporter MdtA [Thiorhodovibrio litoralis]
MTISVRKLVPFLLPVLIIGLALGLFRFLKATKPAQTPPQVQERVWRVAVETINPEPLAPELTLYGQVGTPDLLNLTASATAWVEQVAVRDGDRVRKGDLLLELDSRDFLPRIEQARSEIQGLDAEIESENNRHETDQLALEQEQELLELADQGVARQQRLKTQKVGAEQALDDAKQQQAQQALAVSNRKMSIADHPSRLRGLQARLASAKAKLAQLELEYERASLKAPYDGVIADVEVTAGDQVARGEVLLTLYAIGSLEVRARIPATYQEEILAALNAGEVLSASSEVAGADVSLRLARLDGEAQASGIDGLFKVANHAELLRIGQLLTLRMAREPQADAVAVPMAAVYGGERVYEIEENKSPEPVLRMRGVAVEMLGTRREPDGRELALVRSPELTAGDRLVITHLPNAINGLRVEVVE